MFCLNSFWRFIFIRHITVCFSVGPTLGLLSTRDDFSPLSSGFVCGAKRHQKHHQIRLDGTNKKTYSRFTRGCALLYKIVKFIIAK